MHIMEETEERVRAMNFSGTADVVRINRIRPYRDANAKGYNSIATCKYCGKNSQDVAERAVKVVETGRYCFLVDSS